MSHEQPTMELRQVWHEAWRQTAKGDTAYFGYYVTQRKWIVHRVDDRGFRFMLGAKEEWRDLPIVDVRDAK